MPDLTKADLRVGATYRAKRPQWRLDGYNDRTILWIGSAQIQYDGPAVALGAHYPRVPIDKFLAWASHEIGGANRDPR